GRFEWRGVPFIAWLLQIARNVQADRWERAARERGEPMSPAVRDASDDEIDRRAALADLVSRLPLDQRRVIVERFVEQRSIREIAGALGRTEGAAKNLQSRARESLRARMRDAHDGPGPDRSASAGAGRGPRRSGRGPARRPGDRRAARDRPRPVRSAARR